MADSVDPVGEFENAVRMHHGKLALPEKYRSRADELYQEAKDAFKTALRAAESKAFGDGFAAGVNWADKHPAGDGHGAASMQQIHDAEEKWRARSAPASLASETGHEEGHGP